PPSRLPPTSSSRSRHSPLSERPVPAALNQAAPGTSGPRFPTDRVNDSFGPRPDACCPDCGHEVRPAGFGPGVIRQADLPGPPPPRADPRRHAASCPRCDKVHYGRLPLPAQRGGLLGPRVTPRVASRKGAGRASFGAVRKFLRDAVGLTLSRGQLATVIA